MRRDAIDRRVAAGDPLPPLAGLPVAVKDLEDTAGMRTTYGSPMFRDHVPEEDSLLAERLRAAGAVIVGKTKHARVRRRVAHVQPRVRADAQPVGPRRTARVGAAAARRRPSPAAWSRSPTAPTSASSIRNPAAFCNVVGLRPSPGRWPHRGTTRGRRSRCGADRAQVDDAAFMYDALAGADPRAPLSTPAAPAGPWCPAALGSLRIAWSPDGGGLPVDPAVTAVLAALRAALADRRRPGARRRARPGRRRRGVRDPPGARVRGRLRRSPARARGRS